MTQTLTPPSTPLWPNHRHKILELPLQQFQVALYRREASPVADLQPREAQQFDAAGDVLYL